MSVSRVIGNGCPDSPVLSGLPVTRWLRVACCPRHPRCSILSPDSRQYVQEAVNSYDRGNYFASSVMLGAASEKAIYLLMEALGKAVTDPNEKRAIQNAIRIERALPTMFGLLRRHLERAKNLRNGRMPYKIHEGTDEYLTALKEAIRKQRNNAVHPTVASVNPDQLRFLFAAFPAACRKTYDLIRWLKTHQF